MKELISSMKMKKMKAADLAYIIESNQTDMIKYYITEGHRIKNADVVSALFEKMMNPKFPKALKKILKNKEGEGLDCGFVVIIAGFLEKNHNSDAMSEELMSEYTDIIDRLLKKRVKKVQKKVDIDSDVIREMLLITPDVGYISNDKFVGIYSQKMLRKLYVMSQNKDIGITDTNQVRKMFKELFGKNLLDLIAINILLEKKEYMKNFNEAQTAIWNLMTNFALEFINREEKEHITELIEYYCARRRSEANKNRDASRRISMTALDAETYPRFAKAVAKFEKNGKSSLVKFL